MVAGRLGKEARILKFYNTDDEELLFLFSFATTWFGLKCSPHAQKYTLGMETKTAEISSFSGPRSRKRVPSGQRKWEKSLGFLPFLHVLCLGSPVKTVETRWVTKILREGILLSDQNTCGLKIVEGTTVDFSFLRSLWAPTAWPCLQISLWEVHDMGKTEVPGFWLKD